MNTIIPLLVSRAKPLVSTLQDYGSALAISKPGVSRLLLGMLFVLPIAVAHAAAPTAVDDVRNVLEDRIVTVNVLANDFDADSDVIEVIAVSDAFGGTTQLNPDGSITYTPTPGFLGEATFTYTIQDVTEFPQTSTATVTIVMEEFALPPFAESDNTVSVAEVLDDVCIKLEEDKDGLSAGELQLLERCEGLQALGVPDSELGEILRIISPEEVASLFRASAESIRQQYSAVGQRMNLLKTGANNFSVNGVNSLTGFSGGAAGDEENWQRAGVFASIQGEGADRDPTENESGYEQSGLILTLGADYAVSRNFYLGAAAGYTASDLDYSSNGGEVESTIVSLIGYASFYQDNLSFDLQLGYGGLDFESERRIQYVDGNGEVDTVADSNTEGSQLIASGQIQYDWYQAAWAIHPYARLDYLSSDIDGYGENNAEGLEVEIEDQSYSRLTATAGVHGSYAMSQNWGVLMPTFQLNILSEASVDQDDIVGNFAFDPDTENSDFRIQADGKDSFYYQLGVGVVATLPRGLSLYAEYMQTFAYENIDIYQIQAGIRFEL